MTVLGAHGRNGVGLGGVEIRLVDNDRQRNAEMAAQVGHAGEVVATGRGGFHHAHGQRRAGKRGDNGASHAGRTVAQDGVQLLFAGALTGFGLEQADQLAGVFLPREELGVYHRAEAGLAYVPVAAVAFGEVDGLRRAELHADAASLTAQRVYLVDRTVEGNGLEGAELLALAAVYAVGLPDLGLVARDEGFGLLLLGVEQDMQVGRVHVEVADDLVLRQMGEGRTHRRFAGADTLATSNALAGALRTMDFDIVFAGRQAIDGDTAQVGPEMAEHLGLPQVSYVIDLNVKNENTVIVKKETEDGYQMLEADTPCVLTVLASANKARYMSVAGIVNAYNREVEIWSADSIDVDESKLGLKGSPTKVQKSFAKGLKQAGEVFEVDAEEAVGIIVSKLKEKFII